MSQQPTHHFKDVEPEKPGQVKFGGPTPIFNVKNVPASIDYYVKKLGFQLAWDWGVPSSFACVTRGDTSLFLCEGGQGAPGTWLFINVEDVDLLWAEYQESDATIVQAPTNFSWGHREMNVEDLDGHRFRFASESKGDPDEVPLPE